MIVAEIIESVDIQVPNSIPVKEKIKWINQIHNQLYRDYPFPDTIMTFNTLIGQQFYPLPSNCVEGRIISLIIDGIEVEYVPAASEPTNDTDVYWSIVDNAIFLNSKPTKVSICYLNYRKSPQQLTVTDMAVEPDLPLDFHELYVLGCCVRVARTSKETLELVPGYEMAFSRLEEKADLLLRKKQQSRFRIIQPYS